MPPRATVSVTYMNGPQDGRTLTWELVPGGDPLHITIGRSAECKILLDYDAQVSRLHAQVVYQPGADAFYLEDLGSRNGTFIGQERVKERTALQPGDLFRVGRTWLRVDPLPGLPETTNALRDLPF